MAAGVVLGDIPAMDFAIADFNSVTFDGPPNRNIPSVLLAHLYRPQIFVSEPNWHELLLYFVTGEANKGDVLGFGNLQDFYVFLTRVVLPNAIIENRSLLLDMYSMYPQLPETCSLRYDSFSSTAQGRFPIRAIPVFAPAQRERKQKFPDLPLNATANIPCRSIFRSHPTPAGDVFLQWLCSLPLPLSATQPTPAQMCHHTSELDEHLVIPEEIVRKLCLGALVQRTIRALNIFWFLTLNNATLGWYSQHNWFGVLRDF